VSEFLANRRGRRFRARDARGAGSGGSAEEIVVSVDPPASGEAALAFLGEGDFIACEPIAWGSNYSFAVALRHGEEQRLAVYKPRRGEVPLWDFPDGTLYRREYASFVVARALGWAFVPPTVIRDGPHGVGTVQLYVHHEPKADPDTFRATNPGELMRIFLFDIFANNADRKSSHTLRGADGKLWAIDHGLTFNTVAKLRTVIWDFCGEPIPDDVKAEMSAFLSNQTRVDALNVQLRDLLDRPEIATFYARFERLLKHGRFPHLDPYRNVPRGWW
jgi:uncharacterized repeat protein (TIGR03843 family)